MDTKQIKDKYTCLDYLGDRVVKKPTVTWLVLRGVRITTHP